MARKLSTTERTIYFSIGSFLLVVGIAPTPDDVTIISPLVQIGYGLKLIGQGVSGKIDE